MAQVTFVLKKLILIPRIYHGRYSDGVSVRDVPAFSVWTVVLLYYSIFTGALSAVMRLCYYVGRVVRAAARSHCRRVLCVSWFCYCVSTLRRLRPAAGARRVLARMGAERAKGR